MQGHGRASMRSQILLLLAFLPLVLTSSGGGGGDQVLARPVADVDDHDEQVMGVPHACSDNDHGELPRVYIVHVRKPEHLASAGPGVIQRWHESFLPSLTLPSSGEPRMVASYKVVMSGFAAWLTAGEARAMESKEGFLHGRPDQELLPQTTHSPEFLGLRPDVWRDANRGEGAIIAVIDTGIEPRHASFAGSPMPNPPAGWTGRCYFNGTPTCNDKLLGAAMFHESSQRVWPPYDYNGHGTHVASTIAGLEVDGASIRDLAAGTAAGAAPGAYLAAYNGETDWRMLWSMEQAINSGAHIISISMGRPPPVDHSPQPFPSSAIAVGALAAVRQGILVSCAACNSGPRPSSVCNDAPWIMTVGASTMDRALRMNLNLGNGEVIPGESLYSGPHLRGRLAYPASNGDPEAYNCTNLDAFDLRDKVVMCHLVATTAAEIAGKVQRAGGVAVVLLNSDEAGSVIVDVPDTGLPAVAVNHPNAFALIDYVNRSPACATVELVPHGTITGVTPAPVVPGFSSRGPSSVNGGILKPDILGPGVNVLAANYNVTASAPRFVLMSGTSMATPHLSGIAAIIKLHQLKQTGMHWTPAMVRSAIMTTAHTTNNVGGAITDETGATANFFATGAGHVNPAAAMDPGLVYDIQFDDYVRYLCGLGYSDLEVLQTASIAVDCNQFGRVEPEQLNYPSVAATLGNAVTQKVIRRTVTNVRSGRSSYRAVVSFPAESGVTVSVSPTGLNFGGMGVNRSFDVTFTVANPAAVVPGRPFEGYLKWVSTTQTQVVASPLLVVFQ